MFWCLHVAVHGRRRGADGTVERPFASPHAALAFLRHRLRNGPRGPVMICVHPGVYEFTEPLVLRPEDSGSAVYPLMIVGAGKGEDRPTFSGGRRMDGFVETEHRGRRCWVLDLPEVKTGDWHFTQLFVNGVRRPRTRIPAWDGLADGVQRFAADAPFLRFVAPSAGEALVPGTCLVPRGVIDPAWRNLADVEIVALRYWVDRHYAIRDYDADCGVVSTFVEGPIDLVDEKGEGCRFWIENVGEALAIPGQWYLDRAAGRLSYLPLPGETLAAADVVAPRLPYLVRAEGSVDDPAYGGRAARKVRQVQFSGIRFAHAEYRYPRENPGVAQAQFNLPGAIVLRGAEGCEFRNCELAHVSQYGIEIMKGSRDNQILGCHFHDLGAGAVKVNHDGLQIRADTTGTGAFAGMAEIAPDWGGRDVPRGVVHGARTTIADCRIHGVGRIYPCNAAVWIGDSARNRVVHNHIHDTYYSAVSVGWVWGYHLARACDNLIADNHIHDIGQGLLSDMGAIYLLGVQPGTVVRRNLIRDVVAHGYGGGGIYPDEGSSFLVIAENLVLRAHSGAFTQHYGRDNLVRNNIFAFAEEPLVGAGRCEVYRGFIAERNLLISGNGGVLGGQGIRHCRFRSNVLWAGGEPIAFPGGGDLAAWQREADDAGTVVADPGVSVADDGTMTVAADAAAVQAGFRPFDLVQAGPRPPEAWRPLAPPRPRGLPDVRLDLGQGRECGRRWFSVDPDPKASERGVSYDLNDPTPVCLVVRNAGDGPARGRIAVLLRNADAPKGPTGQLSGPTVLDFDLAPGEMVVRDLILHADPRCRRLRVETKVKGDALMPSALHLSRRPGGTVVRIGECELDGVKAALVGQPAWLGRGAPAAAGEVRIALTPSHLAVYADITDAVVVPCQVPWEGSVFEVFTAMPGVNGRAGNAQIFLQPASSETAATACMLEHGIQPTLEIQVRSVRTARGYEISALIPLAEAKLRPDADKILFEAMFTFRMSGEAFLRKHSLWGQANGNDNASWGCLAVTAGNP